jgi:heptosyltransferase-2
MVQKSILYFVFFIKKINLRGFMKILVELPTWLGDTVMTTPALENLFNHYSDAEFSIVGSFVSVSIIKTHPRVTNVYLDDTKKSQSRLKAIKKLAQDIGEHDIAISFRNSFTSALMLYYTESKIRVGAKSGIRNLLLTNKYKIDKNIHQVEKYNSIVTQFLEKELDAGNLYLNFERYTYPKKTVGINPGATYGSAKRWYPEEFANTLIELSKDYDIVIFGGDSEKDIASDIEKILVNNKITNYQNLAGKTSIYELVSKIAGLEIFITNDSGPMHIAAAFGVPTISIFGPTRHKQTNQWKNINSKIVRKDLKCSPCMKRKCPLKHHNCMKLITHEDVLVAIQELKSHIPKGKRLAMPKAIGEE